MQALKHITLSLMLAAGAATPALAVAADLPPLREVKEIDQNMLWVAMAIEVSDKCQTIAPRTLKGVAFLWSLKGKASDLGYSDAQIKAYIESDEEEARIRKLGEAYVRDRGLDPKVAADLCTFGEQEIAANTQIGQFLRSTK